MAVDSLGATIGATQTSTQSNLSQTDLFKILLTQLKYQDPLKPTDNSEFIAQLAQFTSLDQARQTNENIQSLLQLQATNQSVGLIGHTVAVSSDGTDQIGQVTTISFTQGVPTLTVKTSDGVELNGISLSQLQTVR
jgi:flagellar basal-body rod modification protein FlgD